MESNEPNGVLILYTEAVTSKPELLSCQLGGIRITFIIIESTMLKCFTMMDCNRSYNLETENVTKLSPFFSTIKPIAVRSQNSIVGWNVLMFYGTFIDWTS